MSNNCPMQNIKMALLVALVCSVPFQSYAAKRSGAELRKFAGIEACPSTGLHKLPCPGWEIDHITPLCAGGEDRYWNMQWLSRVDHAFKTRIDVRECRRDKLRRDQP